MEKPLEIILQDPYDLINDIRKARNKPEQINVAFVKHDAVCYDHEADKYAFINTRLTEKDFESNPLVKGLNIEIVSDGKEYVIKGSIYSKLVSLEEVGVEHEFKAQSKEGVSVSVEYVPQSFSQRLINRFCGRESKGYIQGSFEIYRKNTKTVDADLIKIAQYFEKALTEQYRNTPQTAPLGELHLAYHPQGKETNMLFDKTRTRIYEDLQKEAEYLQRDLSSVHIAKEEIEAIVKSLVPRKNSLLSHSYDLVDHRNCIKVLYHRSELEEGVWKAEGAFIGYSLSPYECFKRRADQLIAGGSPKRYCPVVEE